MSENSHKPTMKEQFEAVKKAAEGGDAKAYALLASKYYEGAGTDRDLKLAENWAKKALEEGGDRQIASQVLYWIDRETEDQRTDEESESMKILNRGSALMQQKKYTEAFKCFLKAAQMGHPAAMNNVSVCYFFGYGIKVNKVAAFEWMKKAADGGYESAYYPLAAKYYMGDGCAKSLEKAAEWAKKALDEKTSYANSAKELLDMLESK